MTNNDKMQLKAILYTVSISVGVLLLYAIISNIDTVLYDGILVP